MKYSEFKAEVEKLGLGLVFYTREVGVVNQFGDVVACISKSNDLRMDMDYTDFQTLSPEKQIAVFDLSYQIAKTPLAEREEEKRYRLLIVANLGFMDDHRFLNLNIEREEYFICSARQSDWVKTIFTESEIAKMDITGFQKVEVLDGE